MNNNKIEKEVEHIELSLYDLMQDKSIQEVITLLTEMNNNITKGHFNEFDTCYDYDSHTSLFLRTWRYENDEELAERMQKEEENDRKRQEKIEAKELAELARLTEKYKL